MKFPVLPVAHESPILWRVIFPQTIRQIPFEMAYKNISILKSDFAHFDQLSILELPIEHVSLFRAVLPFPANLPIGEISDVLGLVFELDEPFSMF